VSGPSFPSTQASVRPPSRPWSAPGVRDSTSRAAAICRSMAPPAKPAYGRAAAGVPSAEALVVRGGAVDRRHDRVVEPQVHRQLAAVVRQVVEHAPAQDLVARLLRDDVPAGPDLSARGE